MKHVRIREPIMRRMKRNVLILASLFVLAIAVTAFAQRGPGGPPPIGFGGPNSNTLADYLSLTSEQKSGWQTIQADLRTTIEGLHEQDRTLNEQLHTALDNNSTDAAALGNLLIQIRGIHSQIESARNAADAKFEASLTAEQKVKFAAFEAASEYLRQRGPGGPR